MNNFSTNVEKYAPILACFLNLANPFFQFGEFKIVEVWKYTRSVCCPPKSFTDSAVSQGESKDL